MERAKIYVTKLSKQSSILYFFNKIKIFWFFNVYYAEYGVWSDEVYDSDFFNFWFQPGQTQGLRVCASISDVSDYGVNNYHRIISLCFHQSR